MVLAIVACVGCTSDDGEPCLLIGGRNGLHVETTPRPDPGEYVVIARADGQVLGLDVTVTVSDPELGFGFRCEPDNECVVRGRPFLYFDGPEIVVGYEDGGGPASVEIEIVEAGVTVARQQYAPTYELRQPNGPDCPPTLYQASDTITIGVGGP